MGSLVWERLWFRLKTIAQPRWTWRYILCCGVVVSIIYFALLSPSPLFSSALPAYTGPYTVGTIDVEIPVETRLINEARLKDGDIAAFQVRRTTILHRVMQR